MNIRFCPKLMERIGGKVGWLTRLLHWLTR
jgi:hypothetical protein